MRENNMKIKRSWISKSLVLLSPWSIEELLALRFLFCLDCLTHTNNTGFVIHLSIINLNSHSWVWDKPQHLIFFSWSHAVPSCLKSLVFLTLWHVFWPSILNQIKYYFFFISYSIKRHFYFIKFLWIFANNH